jgi:hypothetical protein
MTNIATETRSVIVEREIPYPPEKIWRALTQPHLIEEWLMKNDFKPVVDHRFNLRKEPQPDVSIVVDCQVTAVELNKTLSYTGRPMASRVSSPGLSCRPARAPGCAWNNPASGRIRSRRIGARRVGGGSTLQI